MHFFPCWWIFRLVSNFHRLQRPLGRVEVQLYSISDLGTRRWREVSVTLQLHLAPKKDPVPIVQEARWASELVWTGAEDLFPTGIWSPDCPARRQSLYWLSFPAHADKFLIERNIYYSIWCSDSSEYNDCLLGCITVYLVSNVWKESAAPSSG
jgi:hypothetical protein